jgi:hypothetical protein
MPWSVSPPALPFPGWPLKASTEGARTMFFQHIPAFVDIVWIFLRGLP